MLLTVGNDLGDFIAEFWASVSFISGADSAIAYTQYWSGEERHLKRTETYRHERIGRSAGRFARRFIALSSLRDPFIVQGARYLFHCSLSSGCRTAQRVVLDTTRLNFAGLKFMLRKQ
jgi:hypothetical protein